MKIGISAASFVPGVAGGLETYFRALLEYLPLLGPQNEYVLFCKRTVKDQFVIPKQMSVVTVDYARHSLAWGVRHGIRFLTGQDLLLKKMDAQHLDIIHHPFTAMNPLGLKTPKVLSFADMQQELFPDFFSDYELRVRKASYKPSVDSAEKVIVPSNFTRQCLIERYGTAPEKIAVIHYGYNEDFREIKDQGRIASFQEQHGLDKPYMFYPAATWPHKNHANLIEALYLLKNEARFDGYLVLTGIARGAQDDLLELCRTRDLSSMVKFLGYLPYEDLPVLFSGARLMVFPSLFEGFGIPAVEAMACGCPVVCSNATSLPEVVGDAGILFEPCSPEDMAEKIALVWNDEARRMKMIESGYERVKLFDWHSAIRKTLDVYSEVSSIKNNSINSQRYAG